MIVNVTLLDEDEVYTVKPGQVVRYTCDEAGVQKARESGQVVTIGRVVYSPSHLSASCKS